MLVEDAPRDEVAEVPAFQEDVGAGQREERDEARGALLPVPEGEDDASELLAIEGVEGRWVVRGAEGAELASLAGLPDGLEQDADAARGAA